MGLNYCPKCGGEIDQATMECRECGLDLSDRKNDQSSSVFNPDIYANLTIRALGWFIDMIIVLALVIPLSVYVNFGLLYIYSNVYLFTIGFFYFFLLDVLNKGQTIGKIILKIKTVDDVTLKQASIIKLFINNITKATPFVIIDFVFGVLIKVNSQGIKRFKYRITQNLSETSVIYI
jgi:uncharacterized RDD family membrane protein YckC